MVASVWKAKFSYAGSQATHIHPSRHSSNGNLKKQCRWKLPEFAFSNDLISRRLQSCYDAAIVRFSGSKIAFGGAP